MEATMKFPWFIWVPRIIIICFALFVGMFSLDVFEMRADIWHKLLGFFIHNIPSLLIILTLLITWKKPLWGGIFYLALTIILTLFWQTYRSWETFLFFTLPPFLVGILFLAAYFCKPKPETE